MSHEHTLSLGSVVNFAWMTWARQWRTSVRQNFRDCSAQPINAEIILYFCANHHSPHTVAYVLLQSSHGLVTYQSPPKIVLLFHSRPPFAQLLMSWRIAQCLGVNFSSSIVSQSSRSSTSETVEPLPGLPDRGGKSVLPARISSRIHAR
jgi:hypothetical protein